jgi:hypothetical protein
MTFAQASASLRQPDRFDSISPAETAIVQSAVGQRQTKPTHSCNAQRERESAEPDSPIRNLTIPVTTPIQQSLFALDWVQMRRIIL